jgi:hypothetical protein
MKRLQSNPHMKSRRNFLRSSLRCGGLIALGGGAALLGWRSAHSACMRTNPCGQCPLFDGCDLENARDLKKTSSTHHFNHAGRPI